MNKQELIEYAERKVADYEGKARLFPETREYAEGAISGTALLISEIKKLDEPQKVKVTKEFDEWYKQIEQRWSNSAKEFALWKICQFGFGNSFEDVNNNRTSRTLSDWVCRNNELAINAVLYGYEAEEELKWVVYGERGYLTSLSISKGKSTGWTGNDDKHGSGAIHFDDKEMAQYTAYITGGTVEKV